MTEQMKTVSNPLTIIAIFAALAEVMGTISLATVDKDTQHIFVWFIMAFPIFLVLAFFITLNFNSKVLYAPGDFKNEENFLAMGRANDVSKQLGQVDTQLEALSSKIVSHLGSVVRIGNEAEREKVSEAIRSELLPIQAAVATTRSSVDSIVEAVVKPKPVASATADPIVNSIRFISASAEPAVIARGKALTISYEIECAEDMPNGIWLGASVWTARRQVFYNTREDKAVLLTKGKHTYQRVLTIPAEAPLGDHTLAVNLWRGEVGNSGKSKQLNAKDPKPPIPIKVVA